MACPGLSGVIDHVSSVFHGTRWGVALHCSTFEAGSGGVGARPGVPSKERKEQ